MDKPPDLWKYLFVLSYLEIRINRVVTNAVLLYNDLQSFHRMLDHDTAYYAEYSILDQCIPHGGVLGIKVDRRSQQGCVYVKMESVQAAAGAYRALHGAWYKRAL